MVFVADSQRERMDANIESIYNLEENLKAQGYDLMKIPYALQLNKRDLPNIPTVDELKRELIRRDEPVLEAVAPKGVGRLETLKVVAKQVLTDLKKGVGASAAISQASHLRFTSLAAVTKLRRQPRMRSAMSPAARESAALTTATADPCRREISPSGSRHPRSSSTAPSAARRRSRSAHRGAAPPDY